MIYVYDTWCTRRNNNNNKLRTDEVCCCVLFFFFSYFVPTFIARSFFYTAREGPVSPRVRAAAVPFRRDDTAPRSYYTATIPCGGYGHTTLEISSFFYLFASLSAKVFV